MMTCTKCKQELDESQFWKQPENSTGYEYSCKKCRMNRSYERRRERRLENGLTIKFPTLANRQLLEEGKKYCPGCKQVLDLSEFSTMKIRSGIASHCRECNKRFQSIRSNNPEFKEKRKQKYQRSKDYSINNKLKRKFGITYEEYKKILDNQGNVCKICGRSPEENGKLLAVDHDHLTGKNRDLLCSSCNICIGFIEKNKLDISKMVEYFKRHEINN